MKHRFPPTHGSARRIPRSIPLLPVAGGVLRIAALEWRSAATLDRVQNNRLRSLFDHAITDVPYYRETLDADVVRRIRTAQDLSVLPVLERSTLQSEPVQRMTSDRLDPTSCHEAATSGSTGMPRRIYFSEREMGR